MRVRGEWWMLRRCSIDRKLMFSKAIQFSRRVSLVVSLVHGPLYFLRYLVPMPSVRVHLGCCAFRVDGFPERRKDTKNERCKKSMKSFWMGSKREQWKKEWPRGIDFATKLPSVSAIEPLGIVWNLYRKSPVFVLSTQCVDESMYIIDESAHTQLPDAVIIDLIRKIYIVCLTHIQV